MARASSEDTGLESPVRGISIGTSGGAVTPNDGQKLRYRLGGCVGEGATGYQHDSLFSFWICLTGVMQERCTLD